eukprot:SAG31_NODE_2255_length_6073_cov_2.134248_2_plen_121_part_00
MKPKPGMNNHRPIATKRYSDRVAIASEPGVAFQAPKNNQSCGSAELTQKRIAKHEGSGCHTQSSGSSPLRVLMVENGRGETRLMLQMSRLYVLAVDRYDITVVSPTFNGVWNLCIVMALQ